MRKPSQFSPLATAACALTMPSWRILISNDDGIFAEGIQALAAEPFSRGHQVTGGLPDQERFRTGHGLTMQAPLRASGRRCPFAPGVTAWACSGTPSDCVQVALGRCWRDPRSWVLSGINHGPTWATDGVLFRHRFARRWST